MNNIEKFRLHLRASMIGRDNEVDLAVLAMAAGEHALYVGPPGVAKSYLINNIIKGCGAKGFSLLMTMFTTPEEVFGPFKLTALQKDEYTRNLERRICHAEISFLDECFKASSAILNALLTMMQERAYDNGGVRVDCPLVSLFGASNELPDAEENLGALYDRFALRTWVRPVPKSMRMQLWTTKLPEVTQQCTIADFKAAQAKAKSMPWLPDANTVFEKIITAVEDAHVTIGDRRSMKARSICQAQAAIDSETHVKPHHLECLRFVLWEQPDQIEEVSRIVLRESNPDQMLLDEFSEEIEAIMDRPPKDDKDACPVHLKLADMVARIKGLRQSAKRDTVLAQAEELELQMMALSTNNTVESVRRLKRVMANGMPPLPV